MFVLFYILFVCKFVLYYCHQWCAQEFFSGGVQQIQLRTEVRENGDLGAVAPSQGFWRQL